MPTTQATDFDTYFQTELPKFIEQSAEEIPTLLKKKSEYV